MFLTRKEAAASFPYSKINYPQLLIWMALEVMSFGTLSKFYSASKNPRLWNTER